MKRILLLVLLTTPTILGCREAHPIRIVSPDAGASLATPSFRIEVRGPIQPGQLDIRLNGKVVPASEIRTREENSITVVDGTPSADLHVEGVNRLSIELSRNGSVWTRSIEFSWIGTPPTVPGSAPDLGRLQREMEARRRAYLERTAQDNDLFGQIARLQLGRPISESPIEQALDRIDGRRDKADFAMAPMIRLAWQYGNDPRLSSALRARIRSSILGFKYWIDEPGSDDMIFWSENHYILFSSSEYLAGLLYPQEIFTNSGTTGRDHARKARARIVRWLEERWRFGFSEWYSPIYLAYTIGPLFNLVDFSSDPEIRERTSIVLDLALYDLARLTHRGSFGLTAGRAYTGHKIDAKRQSVHGLVEILFGTNSAGRGSYAADFFATGSRYPVPHALLAIGRHLPERLVDRSRNGLSFEEAPAHGIGFSSLEDGLFWWGCESHFAPPVIGLTLQMFNTWGLWGSPYFAPLEFLRHLPGSVVRGASEIVGSMAGGSVLSTAHTVAFRTPDAMLSSVQDHRPGELAYQIHAWQATLGDEAVVFTTMPARFRANLVPGGLNAGLDEWTGSLTLPRVVQVDNVAIILYEPPGRIDRWILDGESTHAFFPRAAFDEIVTRGRWTFGRKGDGYIALASGRPTRWQTTGPDAGRELIAPGHRNAWICQVGRRAEDGTFEQFVRRIENARLVIRGVDDDRPTGARPHVAYDAPGLGRLEFGWSGPAVLGGNDLPPADHPRFESPYLRSPLGADRLEIQHGAAKLHLDWTQARRSGDGLP